LPGRERPSAPLLVVGRRPGRPRRFIDQGEGNRDGLIIRGVDSSANFFVNGFRDDVQIFRDLYNAQSVEVLKGPAAITFGRADGQTKGEMSPARVDSEYPHQVLLRADLYTGSAYQTLQGFCIGQLIRCRRHAS
jgi:hypothetical protein